MMFLRSDQGDAVRTLDTNSLSDALHEMFTGALLLTGSSVRAERSVVEAIGTAIPCNVSASAVFEAAIRIAATPEVIDGEERSCEQEPPVSWLPPELRRVMLLSKTDREAFVLRLLLGFPRDRCSQLLQLEDADIDERIVSAVLALARIEAGENDGRGNARRGG
jgi:hypothetical protein